MKRNILICIFISFSLSVFSRNFISDATISYRNALNFYKNGEYGKALHSAEQAITKKRLQIENEISILQNSLASKEFRRSGDKIDSTIEILNERGDFDCIEIINYYVNIKGILFFDNSIKNLKEYIIEHKEFPEACILLGDIYKLEGEYSIAEQYYIDALENSDILDIPNEKYNLLYNLAHLSRLQDDFEKYELRLLNIIGTEKNIDYDSLNRAIKNTISKNDDKCLEKFFQLYRAENFYSLSAYKQLADYYYSINQFEKAFQFSSLAVIIGFTKVSSILEQRDLEYSYKSLTDFFENVENHSDIIEWGIENKVWENYNLFCEICASCGYDVFAMELLKILAKSSPQKYWQEDAVLKLDKIDGIKNN